MEFVCLLTVYEKTKSDQLRFRFNACIYNLRTPIRIQTTMFECL